MPHIMTFREITNRDAGLVGIKGINIAALRPNFKIPAGFVITTETYDEFLKSAGVDKKIKHHLEKMNKDNIQKTANDIQKVIVETEIPVELKNEILESYEALSFKKSPSADELIKEKDEVFVAVRSSYTETHDQKGLSQTTILNIKGFDRLLTAVKVAWASQYTASNIEARKKADIQNEVKNGIIVQKMIQADQSVIGYSHNPNTGDDEEIYLNSIFGLGEGFRSEAFDVYVINKKDLIIKDAVIAEQSSKLSLDMRTGKTGKVMLKDDGKRQKLHDTEIREAARLVKKVSAVFESEQKVEFAVKDGGFYVLQSKKIGKKLDVNVPSDMEIESLESEEETREDIISQPKVEVYEEKSEEDIEIIEKPPMDYEDELLNLEKQANNYMGPLEKQEEMKTFDELGAEKEYEISEEEKSTLELTEDKEQMYNSAEDLKTDFEREEKPIDFESKPRSEKTTPYDDSKEEPEDDEEEDDDDSIFSSFRND